MNKNLYRLVKPYQSDKVYEASSIMHGAGKCHKELKKTNTNVDSFSIMDINSNNIYEFKINPIHQMLLKKDPDELLNNNQNGGNVMNIENIKNQINELTNRVKILEEKILQNKNLSNK
jgi:hypothetical protein